MPDYHRFSVGDFVRDPFFQHWVIQPQETHLVFWKQWLADHPNQRETVAQAREVVQTLGFRPDITDNADFIAVWEAVYQRIQKGERDLAWVSATPRRKGPTWPSRRVLTAAASLVGVVFGILLYFQWRAIPSPVSYSTGYGDTQEIVLPDGSQVTLNANSTLSFAGDWSGNAASDVRTVRLEGEAFFRVAKQSRPDGQPVKFTVHAEDLAIAVLGTQFNVNHRGQAVSVMLTEGQVQLHNPTNTVNVTMTPGELVKYSAQTSQLSQTKVNPEVHTAWRDNRYVFEDTSLEEIKALIENNYGREVRFEASSLRKRKITATIPSTDLTVLLAILKETLAINIAEENERIIFQNQ